MLCTLFYIKSTFLFYTLRVSFCASSPIKAELKQAHLDICSKWSILAWRSRMFTTVAWGRRNTPKDIWRISVPKLKWQDAANVEKEIQKAFNSHNRATVAESWVHLSKDTKSKMNHEHLFHARMKETSKYRITNSSDVMALVSKLCHGGSLWPTGCF